MVAFGWPDNEQSVVKRWQPWFDAGRPGSPMPDPAEEAARLQRQLMQRGLAVFSDQPPHQRWIAQYLEIALRERTVATLTEVLQVLEGRGMLLALRASPSDLEEALRELDLS
jgi:hypothetical protein